MTFDYLYALCVSYWQHHAMDASWHMGIGVAIAALLTVRYQYRALTGGR